MLLFFGDPETNGVKEDAKACVMIAIVMQRHIRELEYECRTRGPERPVRIRMGICTGICTVGELPCGLNRDAGMSVPGGALN